MCNAHNHHWSCTCGFGGEGHLGRRGPGDGAAPRLFVEREWRTFESYVNPNAKCPVCGCPVFFYQSPDGGRVYFDELGPPWPKHPCTDNSLVRGSGGATVAPVQPAPRLRWHAAGWQPFILHTVMSVSPDLLRLNGSCGGKDLSVFILKAALETLSDPREVVSRSLVHARSLSDDRFRLSILLPSLRIVDLAAYVSSIEADSAVREWKRKQNRSNKQPNLRWNGRANKFRAAFKTSPARRSPRR